MAQAQTSGTALIRQFGWHEQFVQRVCLRAIWLYDSMTEYLICFPTNCKGLNTNYPDAHYLNHIIFPISITPSPSHPQPPLSKTCCVLHIIPFHLRTPCQPPDSTCMHQMPSASSFIGLKNCYHLCLLVVA